MCWQQNKTKNATSWNVYLWIYTLQWQKRFWTNLNQKKDESGRKFSVYKAVHVHTYISYNTTSDQTFKSKNLDIKKTPGYDKFSMSTLTVKAFWEKSAQDTEIRRFPVDPSVSSSFAYLTSRLPQVFGDLNGKSFTMYWKGKLSKRTTYIVLYVQTVRRVHVLRQFDIPSRIFDCM